MLNPYIFLVSLFAFQTILSQNIEAPEKSAHETTLIDNITDLLNTLSPYEEGIPLFFS